MKYIIRSIKYLAKLVVLLGVIFVLMQLSGTSTLGAEGGFAAFWEQFFGSMKGRLFAAAVVVWSAVYPHVEYVRRHSGYDLGKRKDAIIKAFEAGGMIPAEVETGAAAGERMVFRGASFLRRLWWLGEDRVTLTRSASGGFEIEGPRRFVSEAQHRIPRYVENENE